MKIIVLSQYRFENEMKMLGLNDSNVDNKDIACISIIGTEPCLRAYLDEPDTTHYFNNEHSNVLNLDFDDLEEDFEWKGEIFKAMSEEQANETLSFIEKLISSPKSTIYIHCRAGMSRSRAIAEFLYRQCMEKGVDVDYSERDEYTQLLNYGVLSKLNKALMHKYILDALNEEANKC